MSISVIYYHLESVCYLTSKCQKDYTGQQKNKKKSWCCDVLHEKDAIEIFSMVVMVDYISTQLCVYIFVRLHEQYKPPALASVNITSLLYFLSINYHNQLL